MKISLINFCPSSKMTLLLVRITIVFAVCYVIVDKLISLVQLLLTFFLLPKVDVVAMAKLSWEPT